MYKALTSIGAALLLKISLDELFDLIHAGKIPYYKGFHSNLGFLFFEHELLEWKSKKLIKESQWIEQKLTNALYGAGKPSNVSEIVSIDVAERYLNLIEQQALLL